MTAVREAWNDARKRGTFKMRDLLKFITCGSVDDGKSTLIGHILYDSKLLYADQEKTLALESKVGSRNGEIDYSLLLDGLTEEREQGITIDVAYRYFTTDVRSFIVADTPGHEEYTRNMAVGASFADLAIILIDATKGVLTQTRRHARICSVMGIGYFVFAINKMDLVGYEEVTFEKIKGEIEALKTEIHLQNITVIPVSATEGDNVARKTDKMRWYTGETLLEYLENVSVEDKLNETGFYMPVQRVCRPDRTFRGFQGQIENGEISVGDEVRVLPTNEKAHIENIYVGDKKKEKGIKGQGVTLTLDREIDVSRGSVISGEIGLDSVDSVTATILWMDDNELSNGGNFFVKLGTSMVPAVVTKILYTVDISTGAFLETDVLKKNEIAVCRIAFTDKLTVTRFKEHKTLGELILIDRVSFMTSACGVVEDYEKSGGLSEEKITGRTRSACMGQQAITVVFRESDGITRAILEDTEKRLILGGRHTYLLEHEEKGNVESMRDIIKHLNSAGIVVLLFVHDNELRDSLKGNEGEVILYAKEQKKTEDIVTFVKAVSSYEFDTAGDALYI